MKYSIFKIVVITLSVVSIIILITMLFVNKDYYQYNLELSKDKLKNPNYAILFTMYNSPERQQMYEDVLNYYVNILKFPRKNIFIVDSSGNGVDTKYVFKQNQAVFNQNNLKDSNIHLNNSTWFEIQSFLFADKTLKDLKNFDYIVKLTAKYKLPDIQKIVIPDNIELVVQNGRKINQTEIIGFKSNLFSILLDKFYTLDNKYNMEQKLGKIKQGRNIGNLPALNNLAKYKRGDGSILDYL